MFPKALSVLNNDVIAYTAYVMSNFVSPAPSFAALGKALAGQAFKGVKDYVDYYRGGNCPGSEAWVEISAFCCFFLFFSAFSHKSPSGL